jgi:FdhD protein
MVIRDLLEGVAPELECYQFSDGEWHKSSVIVPQEKVLTIFVNNQELVSTLCTPTKMNCLVVGYLFSENVISGMGDIASMRVCEEESLADIRLTKSEFTLPSKRILTSGCGGGVSFTTSEASKVISEIKVTPEQILKLMGVLIQEAPLYRISGGIHTSALCDCEQVLVMAEDIGRHNTLDKIMGECLLTKKSTRDKILFTTGRLSSEMLRKAAKMGAPIVTSMTSPTERAIKLSQDLGITLIGYARNSRLTVYSHLERLMFTNPSHPGIS